MTALLGGSRLFHSSYYDECSSPVAASDFDRHIYRDTAFLRPSYGSTPNAYVQKRDCGQRYVEAAVAHVCALQAESVRLRIIR